MFIFEAVIYLPVSRSLPSNGSTCRNKNGRTELVGSIGNASALYSESVMFVSRSAHRLSWQFSPIFSVTPGKYRTSGWITPRLLISTSSLIHYSLIVIPFDLGWLYIYIYLFIYSLFEARGSVVGWGTMPQAGRSRVRFSMPLDFLNLPNLPAAL
jgi:hypothetical protein